MKKQLLFNFSKSLVRKMPFRIAAFVALTLLVGQSTFAQGTSYAWVGGTSSEFTTFSNWNPAPTAFVGGSNGDNFTITATGSNNNEITNTAAVNCRQITIATGVTFIANADITTNKAATSSANGTLNIIAGTSNFPKFYTGNSAGFSGIVNVATGAILTGNDVWRVGALGTSPGTININGGTLTLGTAGGLVLGYATSGILNINSGTVNVNYTAFTSFGITANGLVTIDNGSMIIPGNQTAAVQTFIDAGKIKAVAGKTISLVYDGATKTTVSAIIPTTLGINDVKIDENAIVIYAQNENIKIQSGNIILSDVVIYDLNGRLVASKNNIGSNEASIAVNGSNNVYVVKITTTDGRIVTKKIIQ
ncbi:T9SS sorting signal type C domain-containing protein [Flavobacterium sp. WC2509]|uniref:T9SS sorting signal type C domain-containing protein n=1 Tax=Flavobacterium sp. WC2509 TaxID=3461406 RepID=UPI004043CB99